MACTCDAPGVDGYDKVTRSIHMNGFVWGCTLTGACTLRSITLPYPHTIPGPLARSLCRCCWPALAQVAQPCHVHPFWFLAACAVVEVESGDFVCPDTLQATGLSGGAAQSEDAGPSGDGLGADADRGSDAGSGDGSDEGRRSYNLTLHQLLERAIVAKSVAVDRPCLMAMAWTHVKTLSLFVRAELPGI